MRDKNPFVRRGGPSILAVALVLIATAGLAAQTVIAPYSPAPAQKKAPAKARQAFHRLNLNTAAEAQLAALKPIGPEWARKIVARRPYGSVDELTKAGMAKPDIESARPFLTVGGRNGKWRKPEYRLAPGEKVNLNTAEIKVLMALPGIGRARAEAIVEMRPLARIEDVMKVKGIKQKAFKRLRGLIVVK